MEDKALECVSETETHSSIRKFEPQPGFVDHRLLNGKPIKGKPYIKPPKRILVEHYFLPTLIQLNFNEFGPKNFESIEKEFEVIERKAKKCESELIDKNIAIIKDKIDNCRLQINKIQNIETENKINETQVCDNVLLPSVLIDEFRPQDCEELKTINNSSEQMEFLWSDFGLRYKEPVGENSLLRDEEEFLKTKGFSFKELSVSEVMEKSIKSYIKAEIKKSFSPVKWFH